MSETLDAPSLAIALAEQNAVSREKLPESTRKVMENDTERLRTAGIAARAVGAGDTAPDFTLPDATGTDVSLSERLKDGPVVLSFYRGGWCPYCNLELKALQDVLPEIRDAGGSLLAVSLQSPDDSLSTKEKHDLEYDVLSDVDNSVTNDYGLLFEFSDDLTEVYEGFGVDLPSMNDTDGWTLPLPATYVIGTDGVVRYAFADPDYKHRAEPSQILETLRKLQ